MSDEKEVEIEQPEEIVEEVVDERDYEAEAKAQGWREDFDGDNAVDAKTFVERGERSAAIQKKRAQQEKIKFQQRFDKLQKTTDAILKQQFEAKDKEIEGLKERIRKIQAKAITDGDGEKFAEASTDLERLEKERAAIQQERDSREELDELPPDVEAEWNDFVIGRDWLDRDEKMTFYFNGISTRFRRENPDLSPREFWERLADKTEKEFSYGKKMPSVESGKRGGSKSKTPKKIDDLPPDERVDARKAFESFKRNLPDYKEEDYVTMYLAQ